MNPSLQFIPSDPALPVRTFVALSLPADWKDAAAKIQASHRFLGPSQAVRWVRTDQWHLTLHFFGNVLAGQIQSLTEVLAGLCARQPSFLLKLGSLGGFPNLRAPRVLWLGLTGDLEPLRGFQVQVAQATQSWGDHLENRPFQPHLTLGRVNPLPPGEAGQLGARLAALPLPATGDWMVREARLMRSELTPQGPVHTALAEFNLRPAG